MTEINVDSAKMAMELSLAVSRLRARLRVESGTYGSGWTIAQLSTLRRIMADGPLTAADLAHAEHVKPQSMTETVAALTSGGLATRSPDPNDGRKILISATPHGRQVLASQVTSREAWLARAIENAIEPADRPALLAAVELLNRLAECA